MNWHTAKKLKIAMRRTLTLLLSVAMLSGSVLAIHTGGWSPLGNIAQMIEISNQNRQEKKQKEFQELYGDDWEKVAALQPGDSYIGKDNMYICHEETYVDWKRVYSKTDLDPLLWNGEDRLLLMTDSTGQNLFLGNDYANSCKTVDGANKQVILNAVSPTAVRRVVSGVTGDTSGNNTAEYVDKLVYPELNEFVKNSTGGYPYPDSFQTVGTMNAPYIRNAGTDKDNGDHRKFKIILSKDDGSISGVGLSYRYTYEGPVDGWDFRIELKAVSECNGYTFHLDDGKLRIFENIKSEDDLLLYADGGEMYGRRFASLGKMPDSNLVLYVGKKTEGKRIEVVSLALDDAEQNPEALENVYGGAIEFYHWEKITSSSQLPTDSETYRALLVWDDQYYLQGDDFRRKSGSSSMALYVNEEKTGSAAPGNVAEAPEIDLQQDEFYTMGGMGTPYIRYTGRGSDDGDNDHCPYYVFQLAGMDDQPSEKWLCDGNDILDVCLGQVAKEHGGMDVGIIVGKEGNSGNDADTGKVKLFFNDGGYDTGFDWQGNIFFADDDSTGWDYGQFTLYVGKPVVYPAIRQNYVVGEDQFMHVSQNGAMLKNVTVTVRKGGVLSVESWFMNNGRIVVDGGTLIVQNASNPLGDEEADDTEDSIMLPFADIHPTISGSLELKNGGELIILSDARAAFSNITATTGSSIFNNGMLLAETIDLHSSTLENRKGMTTFVGYDFREIHAYRTGSFGRIKESLVSRLQDNVICLYRRMNSSIHNDGDILYSTGFLMDVVDGAARDLDSGSYTEVRGSESRYMLTN